MNDCCKQARAAALEEAAYVCRHAAHALMVVARGCGNLNNPSVLATIKAHQKASDEILRLKLKEGGE